MVVGIYSLPDASTPKRRCSEGSGSLLPCGRPLKRWKAENGEENEAILEAPEAAEPSSSVIFLEENGGIWHVDGLLELLAGALCATFGADPMDMISVSDGITSSNTEAPPMSRGSRDLQHQYDSPCIADPQQPLPERPAPPTVKLTEFNLQAHTASAQPVPVPGHPNSDDEDRSSVASLSAWVVGTQSPRRHISDGGTQLLSGGVTALASTFSFTPRVSCGADCSTDGSCGCGDSNSSNQIDFLELRWPRRHLPAAGRW